MGEAAYSVYLVRCGDGSLYTGITTDVARRIREHEGSDRGAKFLRGKGPLTVVYQRPVGDRSVASRLEHRIKRLPAHEKADRATLSARVDEALAELRAVNTG